MANISYNQIHETLDKDTTQVQRIAQLEDENKILAGQLELLKGVMGKG